MNNKQIITYAYDSIFNQNGCYITPKEWTICARVALEFYDGKSKSLTDCYKKPSQDKIRAYEYCQGIAEKEGFYKAWESVISHNYQFFTYGALAVSKKPFKDGFVTIYLIYATAGKTLIIPIISVKEWCIK